MGLLRSIPTKKNEALPFLLEVDFITYAERLASLEVTAPVTKIDGVAYQAPHRLSGIQEQLNKLRMILAAGNRNNAWLQGANKTSVIEALLRARAENRLSTAMSIRPFFLFDANKFFIGTPRQDWVKQFDSCLQAINDRNGIAVFDDVENLTRNAGDDAGRLVNTLISHLEHGEGMQAIISSGSKTVDTLKEISAGIDSQFEPLLLKAPPADQLRPMLVGHIARLQDTYRVHYTEEALDEITRLLTRYPGRAFGANRPGNAIDFAEKVGAFVRLNKYAEPARMMELREEIGTRNDELAVLNGDMNAKAVEKRAELGGELADRLTEYKAADAAHQVKFGPLFKAQGEFQQVDRQLADLRNKARSPDENKVYDILTKAFDKAKTKLDELEQQLYPAPPKVKAAHVRQVFNAESGIAIKSEEERIRRLDGVEAYLESQVMLQPAPLQAIAKAYKNREFGVCDPTLPAGVYIFAGGTGLGKNALMEALTRWHLGVENRPDLAANVKPIVVPMNMYGNKSAVTNLSGAARGNIGYGEPIPWMEDIQNDPINQLIFDEANKAHPDMFNAIMQIADTGEIPDSTGKVTDCRGLIITINLNGLTIDDLAPGEIDNEEAIRERLRNLTSISKDAIGEDGKPLKLFTPEFIGRVDGVFVFNKLGEVQFVQIFRKQQIARINQDYAQKGISVEAPEDACRAILTKYNIVADGGRGPRAVAKKHIRPLITDTLLATTKAAIEAGNFEELPPQKLQLGFADGKITLTPIDGPVAPPAMPPAQPSRIAQPA